MPEQRQISLPWMLTIPFILQVVTVVSGIGYISYWHSQRSVESLTNQLMDTVGTQVQQELSHYLATPKIVNQSTSDAIVRGDLNFDLVGPNPAREQFLWQQMQLFPHLSWISLGSETGDCLGIWRPDQAQALQLSESNRSNQYLGHYYATTAPGQRTSTTPLKVESAAFDPRKRPWYKVAIGSHKTIWTDIYSGFTPGTIFIAASQALYDRAGKFLGVSGIDLSLGQIQSFLAQTPISPAGEVFIVERSTGMLVASSSQEPPFRLLPNQKAPVRIHSRDSNTPLIRATAASLQGQFGGIRSPQGFHFDRDRADQYVKVLPLSREIGLDWLIVIVVPESSVMAQVQAGTRTMVMLCVVAVVGMIGLNMLISRWLARPIISLSQASRRIAQGDFTSTIPVPNIQELATLASSFGQMSQEIQQSRQQLEDYSRSLAQQVRDRTAALEAEIDRRAKAEADLQLANQELQNLAYMDGLTQIANRRQFDDCLNRSWHQLKRDCQPLGLILGDVDFFKKYNDTYGHQMGDECLRIVAAAIAAAARRPADLAARYGGEEFAIILPNTSLEGAIVVAEQIQQRLRSCQLPHRNSTVSSYVTLSLGVTSLIPDDSLLPETLLIQADQALYQAKSQGRNQFACLTVNPVFSR